MPMGNANQPAAPSLSEASQGFAVRAVVDAVPGMFDLRQDLIANGVLAITNGLYQFTQATASAPPAPPLL